MIDPISNLPLKDRVAALLRSEIAAGRVADGEELTQESVSQALAVSRIPVREAFLQLENEGMLQRLPNRHVRVIGLTPRRIWQNFQVAAAMEAEIVRLLPPGWEPAEMADALARCRAAGEVGDRAAFFHWEDAVHLSLSRALDNPALCQRHALQRRALHLDGIPLDSAVMMERNEAILRCLERGETEAAVAAVRDYYVALCAAVAGEVR